MNFKERVEELNKQIEAIKGEFARYIADKNISLDERWQVFLDAPANLRGHSRFIERFKGMPEDIVGYDGPVLAERYQKVVVTEFLDVLAEQDEYDFNFSEVDFVAFKEDVLAKNIYSFTFDW